QSVSQTVSQSVSQSVTQPVSQSVSQPVGQGKKHVLYVPNAGHGLEDISRVLGGIVNFSRLSAQGKTFPKLDWTHSADDDNLKLSVTSSEAAEKAALWIATSDDRDFRDAKWKSIKATQSGDAWSAETDSPKSGYKAVFGELTYPGDGLKYQLSTSIKVYKADK
ncbi:MAG: PhoPQ-activated protein PqaA family protein, partial [Planctomycetota bacterium]